MNLVYSSVSLKKILLSIADVPKSTVETINAPEINPHIPAMNNVPITMSLFAFFMSILISI